MLKFLISCAYSLVFAAACAQNDSKMDFETYEPVSTLVVPEHKTSKAKFPFIDVHNHQWNMPNQNLTDLVKDMQQLNMAVMVNLSGQGGDKLKQSIKNIRDHYPGRFIVFTNVDFKGVGENGWIEKAVKQLEEDVKNGANGLKIFKNLGFSVTDNSGVRVTVDDPRLDPIWKKCGELKIPILIHTADPKSFWDPMNDKNERWLELATHPNRKRGPENPVPFEKLIQEQHRMFKKHPNTVFIAAHFGWYPNDLKKLSQLLTEMANVYVEFGAVIAELGRQPRAAREFLKNSRIRYCLGKTAGCLRNTPPISGCSKPKMNIFPIIKNTMHSGECMDWV